MLYYCKIPKYQMHNKKKKKKKKKRNFQKITK